MSSGLEDSSCTLLGLWVGSLLGPASYFQILVPNGPKTKKQPPSFLGEEQYFKNTVGMRKVRTVLLHSLFISFLQFLDNQILHPRPHLSLKERVQRKCLFF